LITLQIKAECRDIYDNEKNLIKLLFNFQNQKKVSERHSTNTKKSDIYPEKSKINYFTLQPFFKRKT